MSIWIPIGWTVLYALYVGIVFIGNKGSLHNYMDPGADWYLVAGALVTAVLWILYGVLR